MTKVLVIEDELPILENICDYLEMNDYEVFRAGNGRAGLEIAQQILPNVIISDIMMPEMDGLELLKALKEDLSTADIPFIFLTAKSEEHDLRLGMNLGADDYIKKPFRNADLIQSIEARLSKNKMIQEKQEQKLDNIRYSLTVSLPHELYTPLNGILGYSQLLKTDIYSFSKEELSDILNNLNNSAQRLNKIVTNYVYYLSLLEILNSGFNLDNEITLDASEIINEQATVVARHYNGEKRLVINTYPSAIRISSVHLYKIINELADNAFKFSRPEQDITINAVKVDDNYKLSIHNYGIGMNQEQIQNIGAYVQFNRTKYEQQGLGLGLSICKKICEIYNIKIDVFSIPNEFLEIILYIPIITAQF
jgi:two-component system, sensor histidine kinase and response regulator